MEKPGTVSTEVNDVSLKTSPEQRTTVQDQKIAAFIISTTRIFNQIHKHPEIAAALAEAGYDQDSLNTGSALCDSVQLCYNARQEALTEQLALSRELRERENTARHDFMDFRIVARALYPDSVNRKALGVWGQVPTSREPFIANARMAYDRASGDSFQESLARHGYTTERFAELEAALDQVISLDESQNVAIIKARESTSIRNEAVRQLRRWYHRFKAIAQRELDDHPQWLAILDL